MHLYFLRHGEAAFTPLGDSERVLTKIGIESADTAAKYCLKLGISFSHIYSSPIIRAQQTAEILKNYFPQLKIHPTDHLTPESDPRNLFEEIRHHTNDSRILLVTHEPFASRCISQLISGTEQSQIVMKTTSLAYVETEGSIGRGSGKLLWLSTNELMRSFRY